jgi:hypothetical protein
VSQLIHVTRRVLPLVAAAGLALLTAVPAAATPPPPTAGPTTMMAFVNPNVTNPPPHQVLLDWSAVAQIQTYPTNTISYGIEVLSCAPTKTDPMGPVDPCRIFAAPSQFQGGINSASGVYVYDGITYTPAGGGAAVTLHMTTGSTYYARAIAWADWDPNAAAITTAYFITGWSPTASFVAPQIP